MARWVILVALTCLTACVERSNFDITAPGEGADLQRVFVGTNRAAEMPGAFGVERGALSFGLYDIAIPPNRGPGQVPWQFGALDTERHFSVAGRDIMGAPGFRDSLGQTLRGLPRKDREVIVYVHGFNNTFNEGVFRMAQIAHDLDMKGPVAHFSWPSAGNPLGYAYDRDSVLFARDDLEAFLTHLADAGAPEILLLGHSMGALLVVETLRQLSLKDKDLPISGVVLVSPDIDQDVFHQQAEMIRELPQPFAIFVSDRDRALSLSARLTGQTTRLGNINDASGLGDLPVTVINISGFDDLGVGNHLGPLASPSLLRILGRARELEQSFDGDRAGRAGLLPGTIITFQKATEIIISPVSAMQP